MNTSNSTNLCYFVYTGDSVIARTIKVMAIILSVGFGVFGNVLVVFIAVKYTRRTNIHHLIVNMAVSDTLVILLYTFLNVPPLINKLAWLRIPDYTAARNVCKIVKVFENASKEASLISLLIISIERYRATRVTALRLRPYTMRQKVAAVTCSWGLSMACSITVFFTVDIYSRSGSYFCNYIYVGHSKETRIWFTTATISLVFYFSLILLLSIITSLRLRRPSVAQANLSDFQRHVRAKRIANAVKMVVCSILLYGCCYSLAFYYFALLLNGLSYKRLGLSYNGAVMMQFINDFLMALNSCLSPYIYIVYLPEFRETTKRLLFCKQSVEQLALEHGMAEVKDQGNNYHSQNIAMQR